MARGVFRRFISSKTTIVLANIIFLFYEIFFTLSVFGKIPGLHTHFGLGMGDMLLSFMTVGILAIHAIGLFICAIAEVKADKYLILLAVCFLPIFGLHTLAIGGNFDGHSGRYWRGLYYDREKVLDEQKKQREKDAREKEHDAGITISFGKDHDTPKEDSTASTPVLLR